MLPILQARPICGLLLRLLRGPESVAAAAAVVAADGGLAILVSALGQGEEVGFFAAACLLKISEAGATHLAALVAAGAVPRLLETLKRVEAEAGADDSRSGMRSAAQTLLNLTALEGASVAAEAAAAGFDAARLRQLGELPDEPLVAAPVTTLGDLTVTAGRRPQR